MLDFWGLLLTTLVNFIVRVATSSIIVKVVVAAVVYVFIFAVLPALFQVLVPPQILQAVQVLVNFFQNNPIGQNVSYVWDWFQMWTLLGFAVPAYMVAFIFRRI